MIWHTKNILKIVSEDREKKKNKNQMCYKKLAPSENIMFILCSKVLQIPIEKTKGQDALMEKTLQIKFMVSKSQ